MLKFADASMQVMNRVMTCMWEVYALNSLAIIYNKYAVLAGHEWPGRCACGPTRAACAPCGEPPAVCPRHAAHGGAVFEGERVSMEGGYMGTLNPGRDMHY
jgi:hypothetical protein